MALSQETYNAAYGGGANALGRGLVGGAQSFYQAQQQAKQSQLDQSLKNAQIGKMEAEATAASNPAPYTLGSLGVVPMDDPRASIPVGEKAAPSVVATTVGASKPTEAGAKQLAASTSIQSGLANLGGVAQDYAKEYNESKNPVKGVLADVLPSITSKYPATAQQLSPKGQKFYTQAQSVLDAIGRERSGGAITGEEWLSFRQFIPGPGDYAAGPAAVKQKLDQLVNEYDTKLRAYAESIPNENARRQWIAQADATREKSRQALYNSFLPQGGQEAAPSGGFDAASELAKIRQARAARGGK
jgi:hypothetical protein